MIGLERDSRLEPIFVAIATAGPKQGTYLGKVPKKAMLVALHAYVDALDKGVETRWPPQPLWQGQTPCRYEMMSPPSALT